MCPAASAVVVPWSITQNSLKFRTLRITWSSAALYATALACVQSTPTVPPAT